MSKLSNSNMLSVFTRLLILLAIAKTLSLALWWFLPADGVELQVQDNYKPKYQRVDFKNMLNTALHDSQNRSSTAQASVSGVSITNMTLKGLYGKDSKGFAIVSLKSSPQTTSIVSVGENFSGYILKTIFVDRVVFSKAGAEYVLAMESIKVPDLPKSALYGNVSQVEKQKDVSRNDIEYYAQNPKQIWKDIAINEVKDGNEIKGFRVIRINEKSKMYDLGLKKGDLIIGANNVRIKSYKDALDIYKDINNLKSVQIVILRNNIEMELIYEIN